MPYSLVQDVETNIARVAIGVTSQVGSGRKASKANVFAKACICEYKSSVWNVLLFVDALCVERLSMLCPRCTKKERKAKRLAELEESKATREKVASELARLEEASSEEEKRVEVIVSGLSGRVVAGFACIFLKPLCQFVITKAMRVNTIFDCRC